MVKNLFILFLLGICLNLVSCNKGISPASAEAEMQKAGFSGTITFNGTWPDSVQRTHLVVFKNSLHSTGDFNILNLSFLSLSIPTGTKSFNYNTTDSSYVPIGPGEYSYVAVAQSKTPQVSFNRKDWYVIGVYYENGDTTHPGKLIIPENTVINNINIKCDFNNLPPQPPGGN